MSQPRVTCYRVGLRMGQPRLPSLLVSHRRPGFYLRVLREGTVGPGSSIERVKQGDGGMSVAQIDGLLYLPGHERADVERASRLTALSPGWVSSFEAILAAGPGNSGNAGLNDEARVPPPAWPGFRSVVVGRYPPRDRFGGVAAARRVRRNAVSPCAAGTIRHAAAASGRRANLRYRVATRCRAHRAHPTTGSASSVSSTVSSAGISTVSCRPARRSRSPQRADASSSIAATGR